MKATTKKIVLAGLFLALGLLLPFLTGQVPRFGNMLLPMHIPVLLAGLVLGGPWGLVIGLVTPVFRSLLFGMPPLFPQATAMSFELATYGLVAGSLFSMFKKRDWAIYPSLIVAMILGRAVWGAVTLLFFNLQDNVFTWSAFTAGAFTTAYPGVILQLLLIPALVIALKRAKFIGDD